MTSIPFRKMSGAGNDFIVVDNRARLLEEENLARFARASCPRRTSIGADGVALVEPAGQGAHDYRMRIFNADGSEAEMCGNASRCVAVFAFEIGAAGEDQAIETLAGTLQAHVGEDRASALVRLSPPSPIEPKLALPFPDGPADLYLINTGVPHAIRFVEDTEGLDVKVQGAQIRHHPAFGPRGANADFVQILGADVIRVRTFERGVEDETLACGTGATAAALVAARIMGCHPPISVWTRSGLPLRIHFRLEEPPDTPPFLEGPALSVFQGHFPFRYDPATA